MDNYSEEDDDSYSSEQEASDDAVHGQVSAKKYWGAGSSSVPSGKVCLSFWIYWNTFLHFTVKYAL